MLVKLPTADNTTDELPFQHGLETVTSTHSPFLDGSRHSTPDRNNVTKMTGRENVPTTSIRQPSVPTDDPLPNPQNKTTIIKVNNKKRKYVDKKRELNKKLRMEGKPYKTYNKQKLDGRWKLVQRPAKKYSPLCRKHPKPDEDRISGTHSVMKTVF